MFDREISRERTETNNIHSSPIGSTVNTSGILLFTWVAIKIVFSFLKLLLLFFISHKYLLTILKKKKTEEGNLERGGQLYPRKFMATLYAITVDYKNTLKKSLLFIIIYYVI